MNNKSKQFTIFRARRSSDSNSTQSNKSPQQKSRVTVPITVSSASSAESTKTDTKKSSYVSKAKSIRHDVANKSKAKGPPSQYRNVKPISFKTKEHRPKENSSSSSSRSVAKTIKKKAVPRPSPAIKSQAPPSAINEFSDRTLKSIDFSEKSQNHDDDNRFQVATPPQEPDDEDCRTAISGSSLRRERSVAYRIKMFAKKCDSVTIKQLKHEFESLVKPSPAECQMFSRMQKKNDEFKKNRYSNIFCLDVSRVILKFRASSADESYIHANRVEYRNLKNTFILTQGPVTATIGDFWRMVWQENSPFIIQLCRATENGVKKCADYFERKKGAFAVMGDMVVTTLKVERDAVVAKTTLQLCYAYQSRRITHYQWLEWEDCKAPPTASEMMFDLLNVVRGSQCPVVVHCSAGIGRSGTLVAVEMALSDLQNGHILSVYDVGTVVQSLRRFRCQAVQTMDQYIYLHRVILHYGEVNGYLNKEDVSRFYKFYAENIKTK